MVHVRDARLVGRHAGWLGQVQAARGKAVAGGFECDDGRAKGEADQGRDRAAELRSEAVMRELTE